jgi:hypothetical protein
MKIAEPRHDGSRLQRAGALHRLRDVIRSTTRLIPPRRAARHSRKAARVCEMQPNGSNRWRATKQEAVPREHQGTTDHHL